MPDLSNRPSTQTSGLGLALSGGGSRAAAFHRGTVQALEDIGLLDSLRVISTVSGGSVFGAAWMAARARGRSTLTFLDDIAHELATGFIRRSITLSTLKLATPAYTRSNLIAETFDRTLMRGARLSDLPESPILCLNTSVLNTGQVGKFSRDGFSSTGLLAPGSSQQSSNPTIPLPDFPLALAATASAAFPVGLPPVFLSRGKHIPEGWGGPLFAHHRRIALTDGGVLENLGVQTLLKSRHFGTWDIIISDAGRKDIPWTPGGFANLFRGAALGLLSLPTLERVTVMMNDKENRHMRSSAFGELERTWLVEALAHNAGPPGLECYLSERFEGRRRRILFIRVNQTFGDVIAGIPHWRICELAARSGSAIPERTCAKRDVLACCGVDLTTAQRLYEMLGGDATISGLNRVVTSFAALSRSDIEALALHARWQVHAMRALYWD